MLYSQADESNVRDPKVLIIDNIGLLASIYKYADVAYIGGAFGSGLHNILEPAVYGCPLLFGPKHHNFPEAAELISVGGAKSISNKEEFQKAVNDYLNEAPKDAILHYCENKRGASKKCGMEFLTKPLTQLRISRFKVKKRETILRLSPVKY